MANVSTYFQKKRALAIAIVASGSGTGGLIFPSMMRQLVPVIGFAWTVRCMGFIVLFNLIVGGLFLRPRASMGQGRKLESWRDLVDWGAFGEMEYTFYAAGSFCVSYSFLVMVLVTGINLSTAAILGSLLWILLPLHLQPGHHRPQLRGQPQLATRLQQLRNHW